MTQICTLKAGKFAQTEDVVKKIESPLSKGEIKLDQIIGGLATPRGLPKPNLAVVQNPNGEGTASPGRFSRSLPTLCSDALRLYKIPRSHILAVFVFASGSFHKQREIKIGFGAKTLFPPTSKLNLNPVVFSSSSITCTRQRMSLFTPPMRFQRHSKTLNGAESDLAETGRFGGPAGGKMADALKRSRLHANASEAGSYAPVSTLSLRVKLVIRLPPSASPRVSLPAPLPPVAVVVPPPALLSKQRPPAPSLLLPRRAVPLPSRVPAPFPPRRLSVPPLPHPVPLLPLAVP
ncbi:hypothetical protein C8R43DRAFT_951579 [Mycena crocata]|nr:hypothetical protein C8R43DRAFT_951579 [Mycena crocata]